MMEMLIYYLKFNALLAVVFICWMVLISGADSLGTKQGARVRLAHLRIIFAALLALPVVITLVNVSGAKGFSAAVSDVLPGQLVMAGQATSELGRDINSWWRGPGELISLQALLIIGLVLGFIAQAVRLAGQWLLLRNIVRDGTVLRRLEKLDIIFSEQTCTPFSTRVLGRNQIILPSALAGNPEVLRVAVKHELQHIRNGDLNWLLLLEVLKLLCFWNPVVYLWQRHFDSLQEFACDEVLTQKDSLSTRHYGHCLLEVAANARQEQQRLLASSYMIPRLSFLNKNNSQLTRRITMFTQRQKNRFRFLGTLSSGVGLVVTLLASLSLYTNLSLAQDEENAGSRPEYLPIITVPPQYPQRAAARGIIGWVQVGFDIDEDGNVIDPYIVDSCALVEAESCIPDTTIFDESALMAVSRYKYGQADEMGRPAYVEGVMQKLVYCLSENDSDNGSNSCQQRLREAVLL